MEDIHEAAEHPLRAWRRAAGLSIRALAARLTDEAGAPMTSAASLVRVENGEQRVANAVMVRLFELSDGELRPDHFILPDHLVPRTAGASAQPPS